MSDMRRRILIGAFRRRISWFRATETPNGLRIPARLSTRVLALGASFPLTIWFSAQHQIPYWFILHGILLGTYAVDDWCEWAKFNAGMKVGRLELLLEIKHAQKAYDMDPREYLYREQFTGGLEADRLMRDWRNERDGY